MIKNLKQIKSAKHVLPMLMVLLTRKDRYLPEIEWSSKSWVHNIFRLYELIFWRRVGIRPELTSTIGVDRRAFYYCHSFEASLALFEAQIREMLAFRIHVPVKIWIPMLTMPQGFTIPASPFLFAIAFDAHSSVSDTISSGQTWAHTVTGSQTLLSVACWNRGNFLNSVTYNGVTMTLILAQVAYLNSDMSSLFYLVAPTTGTNNIVSSLSSSVLNGAQATSYTGMKQSGQPDASNSDAGAPSQNTFSLTLTTVADNCWIVGTYRSLDGVCTAGANTAVRGTDDIAIADNNASQTPAGSHSLNLTGCGNRVASKIWASFAPFVAPTTSGKFLMFM